MDKVATIKKTLDRFVFSKYPQYKFKIIRRPPDYFEILIPVDHNLHNSASTDYNSNYGEFIDNFEDKAHRALKVVGLEDEWIEPVYEHINKDFLKKLIEDFIKKTKLKFYNFKLKTNSKSQYPEIEIIRKDGKPFTGQEDIMMRKLMMDNNDLDGFRVDWS